MPIGRLRNRLPWGLSDMLAKTLISLFLIVAAVGTGATIATVMSRTRPTPAERAADLPPPLVETVTIEPETVTETITGYGSARAYRSVVLTAEVAGEAVELADRLRAGSVVSGGQLLVRIDDRRYRQELEEKKSAVAFAEADLLGLDVEQANLKRLLAITENDVQVTRNEERRLAALLEGQHASSREYDLARLAHSRTVRERTDYENQLALIDPRRNRLRAAHEGRLAEVELAKLNVEHCRIEAPFDGQIDELMVEVGETVQRGAKLAGVIDPLRIEVPIELADSTRTRVAIGAAVELWVDSMPEMRWSGTVERISPDADERSRTFRAYVTVDNTQQQSPLVPGYFLRAQVTGPTLTDVLLIPRGVIVDGRVFVAAGDRAASRQVRIDRYLAERAVVSGELRPGERVIVTNLDMLEEGIAIRVRAAPVVASVEGAAERTPE